MTEEVKKCIEQAERFLVLREHNKAELTLKLKNKGYEDSEISQTVKYLEDCNELDERRYIQAFIRSNNKRHPEGKIVVFQRLLQKGADKSLSKTILDEVYTPEYAEQMLRECADNVIRKGKNLSKEQLLVKIAKYGFNISEIKKLL